MTVLKRGYGLVMVLNLLSNKSDSDESHLSNQFQVCDMFIQGGPENSIHCSIFYSL